MAITIDSTPEAYPSAHDELYFVVSSTNAATTNFKYIFDIKIGNTLVSRLRIFPDPATNKGICNVGNIIRNYLINNFYIGGGKSFIVSNGGGNKVSYVVEFGEDMNGVVTPNLASGGYEAYNYAPPAFRDYSTSYYAPKINSFISNRDFNELTVHGNDYSFITYISDFSSNKTITFNNGVTSINVPYIFYGFSILDFSPLAINNFLAQNFITDATQQYTITINGYTLRVKRVCTTYSPINIHFLNQLGGYETMPFRLVNREAREFERKTYKRAEWDLVGNTMQPYDIYKKRFGGNTQFSVRHKVTYSLNSEYLNEKDYTWTRDLLASPEAYMEIGGYLYPIVITQNNWSQKFRRSDKLFNLAINVETLETNSQYR